MIVFLAVILERQILVSKSFLNEMSKNVLERFRLGKKTIHNYNFFLCQIVIFSIETLSKTISYDNWFNCRRAYV